MKDNIRVQLAKQLDVLISEYKEYRSKSKHDDCSDVISNMKVLELLTRSRAAIERIAPKGSAYINQAQDILDADDNDYDMLYRLVGVAESLSIDLKAGYLQTIEELIHGEIFSDFLDMSEHLIDNGYKDAAAVISGSTLEAHLRQLCQKANIDIEVRSSKGISPKKADTLNSDLTKASIYSKLDQKNVTAWLDLRNKAAHGNYSSYQKEQVSIMTAGIRDFMTRNPA